MINYNKGGRGGKKTNKLYFVIGLSNTYHFANEKSMANV
jgi:hypothetical protein